MYQLTDQSQNLIYNSHHTAVIRVCCLYDAHCKKLKISGNILKDARKSFMSDNVHCYHIINTRKINDQSFLQNLPAFDVYLNLSEDFNVSPLISMILSKKTIEIHLNMPFCVNTLHQIFMQRMRPG